MRKWITQTPGLMLLLPLSGIHLPPKEIGQPVIFSGVTIDAYTKKVVDSVSVYYFSDGRRKRLVTSNLSGRFEFSVPVDVPGLLFVKAGFRELFIRVNHGRSREDSERYYFEVPLIPLDSQTQDNPYQQSEQKAFVLEPNAAANPSGSTRNKGAIKKVTRRFLLKDAVYNHSVKQARLCLTYTQSGKRECFEFTPDSAFLVKEFYESDIVAFQAEAPGYQVYKGNLILNEMDGSSKDYVIRLTPELTLLAATVTPGKSPLRYMLIAPQGNSIQMQPAAPNHCYAVVSPGMYEWQAVSARGQVVHTEKIPVQTGVTYITFALKSPDPENIRRPAAFGENRPGNKARKATPPATDPLTSGPVPEMPMAMTVYFARGEYHLLPEAMEKLNQVAAWLRANPGNRIVIRGHTDNVGVPARNMILSEYRCRRTASYLIGNGVAENQIKWFAEGGEHPARPNDDESNKKWNRRVEIELIP